MLQDQKQELTTLMNGAPDTCHEAMSTIQAAGSIPRNRISSILQGLKNPVFKLGIHKYALLFK